MEENRKSYENLANAIILQAMKDYVDGYRTEECRKFFKSDWFKTLTNIDGDYIIKLCNSGIKPEQII